MTKQNDEVGKTDGAILLKWQSDVRWLIRALKLTTPDKLSELREAQYFAKEYLSSTASEQSLNDVINASFIQDMSRSKWQTGAMQNIKKIFSTAQKNVLRGWAREYKKIFEKDSVFSKEEQLSPLAVTRVYGFLNKDTDDRPQFLLANHTLLNVARSLPFFDEKQTWSKKAQQRFSDILVTNLSHNLAQKNANQRSDFVVRKLAQATIPESNSKRTLFMIDLLGRVADTFGDRPNPRSMDIIIKNLLHQRRFDAVRQIRKSFHLDSPIPTPINLFKFFKRKNDPKR